MNARNKTTPAGTDFADNPSVAFVSLGCPKNLVDSEQMLGTLVDSGCKLVSDHDEADTIIINTCGFLEESKEESIAVINEAIERKKKGKLKRVVVAGCLVQRHRAKLLEWSPGIDAMIGVFDRDHILEAVSGQLSAISSDQSRAREEAVLLPSPSGRGAGGEGSIPKYWIAANALQAAKDRGLNTVDLTVQGTDGKGIGYFESDANRFRLTPRHWAYLRVSEGCNQKCAFCTIPSIRGKMRSKPLDRIVSEARQLLSEGAFELNLIGQDTTSYGYDIYGNTKDSIRAATVRERSYPGNLIGMLNALNDAANDSGGAWIRLMYVYPTHFTDEMIDTIASLPNIVKYIDIPLQHMSDNMLTAMRRNITRKQQEELLYKLRERIPGLAIRTTLITGFPGETEEDHNQLIEFIEDFQFDILGVFKYSREEGTPAGTMDMDDSLHVPDELKAEREAEIMLTQQEIAFENARFVAEQKSQFDVLIDKSISESDGEFNTYQGRCYHQAPQVDSVTIVQTEQNLSPGELVRCTITDADGYDLIAKPTEELERKVALPVVS